MCSSQNPAECTEACYRSKRTRHHSLHLRGKKINQIESRNRCCSLFVFTFYINLSQRPSGCIWINTSVLGVYLLNLLRSWPSFFSHRFTSTVNTLVDWFWTGRFFSSMVQTFFGSVGSSGLKWDRNRMC